MKKIKLNNWGCCTDHDCFFRKQCAQHETAGDYRTEDGFSPEIFYNTGNDIFKCKTAMEPRSTSPACGADYPNNIENLGRGFTSVSEFPEELTKKGGVSIIDVDDVFPKPDSIIIENENYESLQEFIMSAGGRFFRKNELENMTVKELIEMLSPNVKEKTNFIFIVDKPN